MFLILVLLGAAITAYLVQWLYSLIRHSRNARRLSCKEAPLYPSRDPFGILNLVETVRADREKRLPRLAEKRIDLLSRQHGRYVSTFRIRYAGRENVMTVDPKNIQAILATQFTDFCLGDLRRYSAGPLVGHHGIFTSDGQDWSRSRALLRPQFSREQINNLDLEERHVQCALQAMPVHSDGWTPELDIQSIFFRLTIDTATELLFGKSCDSQTAALQHGIGKGSDSFRSSFDRAMFYVGERLRFENLAWLVHNQGFQGCIAAIHEFADHYVQLALEAQAGNGKPNDLVNNGSKYIFLHALAAEVKDPIELRNHSLNVLLAGRDTTAALMSWTVLLLARHPHIFQRLRAEVLSQFGSFQCPQNLNFTSLKGCQYLQHCLNETLRLHPPIPIDRRSAARDTALPRGGGEDGTAPIYIRKGQTVQYSIYTLHRRRDIWGQDADVFNPDRWAERKMTWEYIPFNGGPRVCIGQQFAIIEASYVLVRLLQRFDALEDVNADWDVMYQVNLISCPSVPVTVKMHLAAAN